MIHWVLFSWLVAPFTFSAGLAEIPIPPKAASPITEVQGRVFYDKLNPKEPSFFFHSTVSESGGIKRAINTYSDKQGKPLIIEESEFAGEKLLHYIYKQNQVTESGVAGFKEGKVVFSFTSEGKTETDSETVDPTMIVGPMIGPLLEKNWTLLMNGEQLKVRYLAIERLETIGFKFFKDKERNLNGREVIDILMKPSSFFISALVSPVRITVTKEAPHWILESDGRTPIRVSEKAVPEKRKDWKAIDARVEYDAPKEIPPPASK